MTIIYKIPISTQGVCMSGDHHAINGNKENTGKISWKDTYERCAIGDICLNCIQRVNTI